MRLSSNTSWFTLDILDGPKVAVYSFTGAEEVSKPFEFYIEVVSEDCALELRDMLGHEVLFKIADHSGVKRLVHGIIRTARQLQVSNKFTHYQVELVPRCHFLDLNQEHRIFQNKTVKDIIEGILKETLIYSVWAALLAFFEEGQDRRVQPLFKKELAPCQTKNLGKH